MTTKKKAMPALSTRVLRIVIASLLVAGTSLGLAVGSAPALAADEASNPVERLGACLAGGGQGDVLLLIDESESIRSTDPDNNRVDAAKFLVNRLAEYTAESGATLSVQISTFAQDFTPLLGWTPLDASSVATVQGAVDQVATRNRGRETDYWTALDGARRELAAAASARTGAASCQAIVWFSDGELWFNPVHDSSYRKGFAPDLVIRGQAAADEAKRLAQDDLCRQGGLADQLRTSGIITFGIGLDGPGIPPGGFDLMESAVAGTAASGATCGSVQDPKPGQFFSVHDLDGLLFAFDALSVPGQEPIQQERGICQLVVCTDQGHRVVVDDSTRRVTILASSSISGAQVSIETPAANVVAIPTGGTGTVDADGAVIAYAWESDRTVSLAVDGSASTGWAGLWQLAFTDPTGQSAGQSSRSNIRVLGDIVPVWRNSNDAKLYAEEKIDGLEIGVEHRDGSPVGADGIAGAFTFSAEFRDAAGKPVSIVRTDSAADLQDGLTLDLAGVTIGAGTVTLRSQVTTADTVFQGEEIPGTPLQAEAVTFPVTVLPPLEYPITGTSIDFGQSESSTVSLTAKLPVTGDGCVRLSDAEPAVLAGPQGIGKVRVTAGDGDTCYSAADGGVPLTLTTDKPGNGTVNGTFVVVLEPKGGGPTIQGKVAFTASLLRPIESLNFWLTLILAIALGPGIPLGLLYLFKWFGSVIPSKVLYGFVTDITVRDGAVQRAGAPFALLDADTANQVSVPSGTRRLDIAGVRLWVKLGASPFGRGYVTVDAAGRSSASSASPSTDRSGLRARLPLDVHNRWVVLHTPGAPADTAQLLVLIGTIDATARDRFVQSVANGVPARLRELVAAESAAGAAAAPPASSDPFRGGDTGAPAWGAGGPFGGSETAAPVGWGAATQAASTWDAAPAEPASPAGTASGDPSPFSPAEPSPFAPADPFSWPASAPPGPPASDPAPASDEPPTTPFNPFA